jgi:hypothetical protein
VFLCQGCYPASSWKFSFYVGLVFLQGLKSVGVVFPGLVSSKVVVAALGYLPFLVPLSTLHRNLTLFLCSDSPNLVPQTSNLKFSTRKIPTAAFVFLVCLYHDFLWYNQGCFSYVSADIKYLWCCWFLSCLLFYSAFDLVKK